MRRLNIIVVEHSTSQRMRATNGISSILKTSSFSAWITMAMFSCHYFSILRTGSRHLCPLQCSKHGRRARQLYFGYRSRMQRKCKCKCIRFCYFSCSSSLKAIPSHCENHYRTQLGVLDISTRKKHYDCFDEALTISIKSSKFAI